MDETKSVDLKEFFDPSWWDKKPLFCYLYGLKDDTVDDEMILTILEKYIKENDYRNLDIESLQKQMMNEDSMVRKSYELRAEAYMSNHGFSVMIIATLGLLPVMLLFVGKFLPIALYAILINFWGIYYLDHKGKFVGIAFKEMEKQLAIANRISENVGNYVVEEIDYYRYLAVNTNATAERPQ